MIFGQDVAEAGRAIIAVVGTSREMSTAATVALLKVTQRVLEILDAQGLADDVGRVKNSMIARSEARTAKVQAEAMDKMADVVAKVNATLPPVGSPVVGPDGSIVRTVATPEEVRERLRLILGEMRLHDASVMVDREEPKPQSPVTADTTVQIYGVAGVPTEMLTAADVPKLEITDPVKFYTGGYPSEPPEQAPRPQPTDEPPEGPR